MTNAFKPSPTVVTFEIDDTDLGGASDQYLVQLWHIAQANPAPHGDRQAGELVERIAREIIRRWLRDTPPELWHHQGRDYFWGELRRLGRWVDGRFVPHHHDDGAAENDDQEEVAWS